MEPSMLDTLDMTCPAPVRRKVTDGACWACWTFFPDSGVMVLDTYEATERAARRPGRHLH